MRGCTDAMEAMGNQEGNQCGRYDAVMRQCRAIERHAAGLRGELLCLAEGEGDRQRVDRVLRALREQLHRAEVLADAFEAIVVERPRDAA
jgi:hypothetical protein